MRLALQCQQEGKLERAEALYEQALIALPEHFDALHMLGVVKLQLGKSEQALPYLLSALPLAPGNWLANCRHNVGLCLMAVAQHRGILEDLKRSPTGELPSLFGRATQFPVVDPALVGRVSVILGGADDPNEVQRSLNSIMAQRWPGLELIVSTTDGGERLMTLEPLLAASNLPFRLVAADPISDPGSQLSAAVAASTGDILCFLRCGDQWGSGWLRHLTSALHATGARWGFSGLRAVDDSGRPVAFGEQPEVDEILAALDSLYQHRTASLTLTTFNPLAGGGNLIARRDLWLREPPVGAAGDPLLAWAGRASRAWEPVFVDEPDYLFPAAQARRFRHGGNVSWQDALGRMGGEDDQATGPPNDHLRHGLARFWSQQWLAISSHHASSLSYTVLTGCAATLGLAPRGQTLGRA